MADTKKKTTAKTRTAVKKAAVTAKKPTVSKKTAAEKSAKKPAKTVRKPKSAPAKTRKAPQTETKPAKSETKTAKTPTQTLPAGLRVPVLDADGKSGGRIDLPDALFAAPVNMQLIQQAVRVHQANQRSGNASTKTRGEVEGSTRKIYRQKGTGRARHGGIRAPIFVGGGIVFGPKPRDYSLKMPQKMKHQALAGALTSRLNEGKIVIVDGLEKLQKTKLMARSLSAAGRGNESALLVIAAETPNVFRTARNIDGVDVMAARELNVYEVLSHARVIVTKDAVAELKQTFIT